MHTCDIILDLAHAAKAEGIAQEQLASAEFEYDEALRLLEEARDTYDEAGQLTAKCIYAVGDLAPCNAGEQTPAPGETFADLFGRSIN